MAMKIADNDPMAILIHNLHNKDFRFRRNKIRSLSCTALALGQEQTRNELVPFLTYYNDEKNLILRYIAEELNKLVPYIGRVEYATVLLPPLKRLCDVDFSRYLVCKSATICLCKITNHMKEHDLVGFFIPVFKV